MKSKSMKTIRRKQRTPTPAERRRRRKIEDILNRAKKACEHAMETLMINDADFEEMEYALGRYIA